MTERSPTLEQQAVIDHPQEPVRIAAGAGTGKTATMTDRLVGLIRQGLDPEAALGITFTNKSAEELADRLRAALPSFTTDGREVGVTTYHGFAYQLLQEFGAFVGVEHDVEVIGPGYVRQLLFESLDEAAYQHLDLAAPAQRVAEAATLASQLGDNLMTASDLMAAAPKAAEGLWAQRLEFAGIVGRYGRAKRDLGVADYGDLIRYAYELVTLHPTVAARVRERYRAVVLDEYQDTAPAQHEMLRALFGAGFPVTAVGDTDQTIYEWRGASRQNFAGFPVHFRPEDRSESVTLPLSVNFRSGATILGVAHEVRRQIHGAEPRRLKPVDGARDDAVSARWFRTAIDEATWIAGEAVRLHDEEHLAWSDIAVLFRKNQHMALVRDACSIADIPVEVASLGGLLDVPEVADLVGWLRILHSGDDAISLARILTGSRFRLGLGDLAHLVRWGEGIGLYGHNGEATGWPLLAAIDRMDEIDDIPVVARSRLADFRRLYRTLLTEAQGVSLVECRRVLDGIEAWEEVGAMEHTAALSTRLNLYWFLDLAQEWSPLRGRPSLDAFLGYLELLQSDRTADELDTARVGGSDALTLLTVHRAKGLEWEAVFLPALARGTFPATSLGYDNPDAYARYLPYELRLDAHHFPHPGAAGDAREVLRARHLEAEWRTAYVAVTRARLKLHLTGAHWYGGTKPKDPSALFELAASVEGVRPHPGDEGPGERPDRLAFPTGIPAPDPTFPDGWANAVREQVRDPEWVEAIVVDRAAYDASVHQLRMLVGGLPAEPAPRPDAADRNSTSVTGLVTLAVCPLRFYWSEVDPLPRRPSAAQRRGVDVHRRIELHNRGAIAFDDVAHDLYDVPAADAHVGTAPSADPFEVFMASRFAGRTPRFIETAIDLEVGPARVRGRVDAVYESDDGGWEIVDYKSGIDKGDPQAIVQLEAYAVAAVEGAIGAEPPEDLRATFLYLGGQEAHEVTYRADAEWVVSAASHLTTLAEAAMGTEFPPTPGAACRHCDFVKFCDAGRSYLGSA